MAIEGGVVDSPQPFPAAGADLPKGAVFFLGGQDLEMLEISNILGERKISFHDKKLPWGAKLSAYKDELAALPDGSVPVLVELQVDFSPPPNAVVIDHHGRRAGRDTPTSLEQVARMLGLPLDRERQLISANDRSHIPGMKAINATPEEILRIRLEDRKAQGVTEEDEAAAERSVKNSLYIPYPKVAVVDSDTPRSSPVVDRISLDSRYKMIVVIIVFSKGGVFISGPGDLIEQYVKNFQLAYRLNNEGNPEPQKEGRDYWFGGSLPDVGYFGAVEYDRSGILEVARKYVGSPVSQHVFLFPFTVDRWRGDRLFKPPSIHNLFELLEADGWEDRPYPTLGLSPSPGEYSEYSYFHDFARNALFEKRRGKGELFSKDGREPDFVSCLLRRPKFEKGAFEIWIRDNKRDSSTREPDYRLRMVDVSLRLFKTGVIILAFELLNDDYPSFHHIQRINDFGRRVYPQFLGDEAGKEMSTVKDAFLPDRIRLSFEGGAIEESFELEDFLVPIGVLRVGRHITDVIGKSFTDEFKVKPIIDDRMYTLCWYNNKEMVDGLVSPGGRHGPAYETSSSWYRFVFLDGKDCYCPDLGSRAGLIDTVTYRRWIPWRTLYGISRYSLVCLTNSDSFVRTHMRRHYRLMAEILLAQRASLIAFASRVSRISMRIDQWGTKGKQKEKKEISIDASTLHGDFIGFINSLWFSEVTPQEQGIEMYEMAVRNMGLREQVDEMRKEIESLYEFLEMEENRQIGKTAMSLSVIAALGIPLSLVLAYWGVSANEMVCPTIRSFVGYPLQGWSYFWFTVGSAFVFGIGLVHLLTRGRGTRRKK